jgi:opacity protein-like surface antigen
MRLLTLFFLLSLGTMAQELKIKNNEGGLFSLGVRTTLSAFNHGQFGYTGSGVGGQFRLQFADRVNSDWFFDYITGNIEDYAHRTDYHIGWSVMYYLTKESDVKFRPYVLAGHCFDYTRLTDNADRNNFMERWSSAVQGGAGVHYNLSKRLDLSVVGQYMIHLGNHVHAHKDGNNIVFHEKKGASMEGHLLFHVGINYKIGDLW